MPDRVAASRRPSRGEGPSCPGLAAILTFQDNARYNENSIQQDQPTTGEPVLAEDKLYTAEYLGSGTFVISKPKRKKTKVRQSQLKNPQRGSRK
jgi:hypothetical protein